MKCSATKHGFPFSSRSTGRREEFFLRDQDEVDENRERHGQPRRDAHALAGFVGADDGDGGGVEGCGDDEEREQPVAAQGQRGQHDGEKEVAEGCEVHR